jgi:hypothetical protein
MPTTHAVRGTYPVTLSAQTCQLGGSTPQTGTSLQAIMVIDCRSKNAFLLTCLSPPAQHWPDIFARRAFQATLSSHPIPSKNPPKVMKPTRAQRHAMLIAKRPRLSPPTARQPAEDDTTASLTTRPTLLALPSEIRATVSRYAHEPQAPAFSDARSCRRKPCLVWDGVDEGTAGHVLDHEPTGDSERDEATRGWFWHGVGGVNDDEGV